jgi:hypothetical protein
MGIHSIRIAWNERSPTEPARDPSSVIDEKTRGLATHPESGRLRLINTPMGHELISELNSFEVGFTSAGNMRVDVRSEDPH